MIALVKDKSAPGAILKECPLPKINSGEVLLRVHRSSICGSDLAIYDWKSWAAKLVKPPLIFGHEVCGEVVESRDKNLPVGTRVACESHIWCGTCVACYAGDRHLCHNTKLLGFHVNGGFAEFLAMPAKCARKIQDPRLYDFASMFEPLGNAVYATLVEPVENKTVFVLGCGPQGLFAIQVAKASGARFVVALEQSSYRARLARKLGADRVISSSGALKDRLLSSREAREGFDVVLEMSGAQNLIALAPQLLRNGGRLSLFGIPSDAVPMNIADDVIFKGIRIYGILGRRLWETWAKMEGLLKAGDIRFDLVATHTFDLKDYKRAFTLMQSKEKNCGKIIFNIKE